MSYQPLPLASGSTLLNTRDEIRTNFEIIQNRFEVDHTLYSSGTGKHNKMTMPVQSPDPTCAASEGLLFFKTVSAKSELMFDRDGIGAPFQLTSGSPSALANGYTFLPGGLLLQWGTYTAPSGVSGNLSFPTTFGTVYSVVVTINRGTSTSSSSYDLVLAATPTTTTFKVNSGFSSSHSFYMQAIGTAP